MTTKNDRTKNAALARATEQIRKVLDLETLDTRNRDSLDFHDLSVASIRRAIEMAFEAGYEAGREGKGGKEAK
jgi:hypothetical protein